MTGYLRLLCFLFVTALVHGQLSQPAAYAQGDAKQREKSPGTTGVKRPVLVKLTTDQEKVALEFARKHHPELANLLEQLQRKEAPGFARGIREVHISAQRLERFRDKQPARFKAELDSWKRSSEIRLLTAKWVMSQDPKLEKQIRELLRQRQEAQLERLRAEREKVAKRLEDLDRDIKNGTNDFDEQLTAEWDRLKKQAGTAARLQRKRPEKNNPNTRSKTPAKREPDKKTKN